MLLLSLVEYQKSKRVSTAVVSNNQSPCRKIGIFLNIIIKGLINTLGKKKGVFGSFLFSCLLQFIAGELLLLLLFFDVFVFVFGGCWHIFNIKSVHIDGCKMED